MSRALAAVVGVPLGAAVAAAALLSVWLEPRGVAASATCAVGVVVPPAVATVWLARRNAAAAPAARVAAVVLGMVVRLVVGLGGGLLAYAGLKRLMPVPPLLYWLWLLGIYLLTLLVETAALARMTKPSQAVKT